VCIIMEAELRALKDESEKGQLQLQHELQQTNVAVLTIQNQQSDLGLKLDRIERAMAQQTVSSQNFSDYPIYDSTLMTPDYFISEAEDYFSVRNTPRASYILLVGRMLGRDSDVGKWWRATKASAGDWSDFKRLFRAYEGSTNSEDSLREQLYSKRQRLDEAFESYAWEMLTLYRRIDPSVGEDDVVSRILNSCLPEVAVLVDTQNCATVSDLVIAGRQIIQNLNKVRKIQGQALLRARQNDPMPDRTNKPKFFTKAKYHSSTTVDGNDLSKVSTSVPTKPNSSGSFCKFHNKAGHTDEECRTQKYMNTSHTTTTPKN